MRRAVKEYESSEKGDIAMRKVLSIFALLMAASMLFWLVGCGGDDDDDDCAENVAPSVVSVTPNGGDVAKTAVITVTFSKVVDSYTITLGGAAVTATSTDNKVVTFSPAAEGDAQALSITATDACGASLDPAPAPVSFNVKAPDTTPPSLVGASCAPPDGKTGVDPTTVTEIKLVFSEELSAVTVDMIEPAENINAVIDGVNVTVEFLGGWSLGNEVTVDVKISATDLSANVAELSYGFTTMAKE
jgi:hypothetical protein